jgi:hypothetical protein
LSSTGKFGNTRDLLGGLLGVKNAGVTMEEFKMAVRQFSINKEFDLGTEKSDKQRY